MLRPSIWWLCCMRMPLLLLPHAANDEGMNPLWVLYSFLCLRPTFGAHCACIPSPLKIMTSSLLGGGRPFGRVIWGHCNGHFGRPSLAGEKRKGMGGTYGHERMNGMGALATNQNSLFSLGLLHCCMQNQKSYFESLFLAFSAVLRGGGCGVVDLKQTSTLYTEFVGNVRFFVEHSG